LTALGSPDDPARLLAFHDDDVHADNRFEIALGGSGEVEILGAAVFDNRLDDDATGTTWSVDNTQPALTAGKIGTPHLIRRKEWGADPFRGAPIPLARPSYDQITFHHTACCSAYSYEDGIRQVKEIQTFHQDGRGWSGIGYHFLLDQSGRLYQGHPFLNEDASLDDAPVLVQGAPVGGHNVGNIGVSVLGIELFDALGRRRQVLVEGFSGIIFDESKGLTVVR